MNKVGPSESTPTEGKSSGASGEPLSEAGADRKGRAKRPEHVYVPYDASAKYKFLKKQGSGSRLRTPLLVAAGIAILCAVLFGMYRTAPRTFVEMDFARMTRFSGKVYVKRMSSTMRAEPAMKIKPGDIIFVIEGGDASVEYSDGTLSMNLVDETAIQLFNEQSVRRISAATGRISGTLKSVQGGQRVVIETPHSRIGGTNAVFVLMVADAMTQLEVHEGRLDVYGKLMEQTQAVGAGNTMLVDRGMTLRPLGDIPPAETPMPTNTPAVQSVAAEPVAEEKPSN